LEKLLSWNQISSSDWQKVDDLKETLGDTYFSEGLRRMALLVFSRDRFCNHQLNLEFIGGFDSIIEKLYDLVNQGVNEALRLQDTIGLTVQQWSLIKFFYRARVDTNVFKRILGINPMIFSTQSSQEGIFGLADRLEASVQSEESLDIYDSLVALANSSEVLDIIGELAFNELKKIVTDIFYDDAPSDVLLAALFEHKEELQRVLSDN
ncbi:MAG: hypothetical protein O2962_05865, partial [Cyanobacteria bacterium]|nr:hypothetical protein [Cyanobacteriota bacterium]